MADEYLNMKTKDGRLFKMLNLCEFRFIIESNTLGAFHAFDHAETSGKWGPRWLRSDRIHRRSPEVWSTNDPTAAMEMIARVLEHHPTAYVVRMPKKALSHA